MIRLYQKNILLAVCVLIVFEVVLAKFVSNSPLGVYKKAAVATNGQECAKIGSDILEHKNGSAVDAAIAALLCEGVACLHSMGLGGGFLMTIYNAATGKTDFLDARITAPGLANETMFNGNSSLAFQGGLSIALPGELMGYWEAHQKYGRVPWKDLFEPSIELCKTGTIVTKYLYNSLKGQEEYIRTEESLKEILINKETGLLYGVGDRIKRPKLAETLRKLADSLNPVDLFYKGEMAKQMVYEIQKSDGIITENDFATYKVKWTEPTVAKIGRMTMYTAPPPASGALITFMMNILEKLLPADDTNIMWQRIIETFKWAYAKRTKLGDPDFNNITTVVAELLSKEYADSIRSKIDDDKTHQEHEFYGAVGASKYDYGTSHISVLAPDGSAVSVTSTINQVLGSKIRSKSTGIIFNDGMDSFSSPNTTNESDKPIMPNNFIKPHARPLTTMAPTILVDENNEVQLIVGAAGGARILTAIVPIMILNLWYDYNIKEAIDAYRIHHQLFPMQVQNEKNFPQSILDFLQGIGHNVTMFSGIGSGATAIANNNGNITANSDYRREGRTAGF